MNKTCFYIYGLIVMISVLSIPWLCARTVSLTLSRSYNAGDTLNFTVSGSSNVYNIVLPHAVSAGSKINVNVPDEQYVYAHVQLPSNVQPSIPI